MIENNNERRKKTITVTIIGIIAILIVLITATYAYFSASSKAKNQEISTAKVDLLVEVDPEATHIENIKPTTWYVSSNFMLDNINENNEDIAMIPIKVTNKSTIDINFDLNLQAKNLKLNTEDKDGNKLEGGSLSDIKYILIDRNGTSFRKNILRKMGDFETPDYKHKLLFDISLKKDQSLDYILFIYISDTEEGQNQLQGLTFDVEITANTTNKTSRVGEKLADAIKNDFEIKNRKPSYKAYPTYKDNNGTINDDYYLLDNGLFKMQNQNIYYFRGDVTNGSLDYAQVSAQFGKIKDGDYAGMPIGWRILRINADDSVTLMLDDSYLYSIDEFYNSIKYSETGNTKYSESNVKQVLEAWYDKTFSEEEKDMIQETEYCNDTDGEKVLERLNKDKPEPTLECSDDHKVKAFIGLPTADEAVLAGGLFNKGIMFNTPYINSTVLMTAISENKIAYISREFINPAGSNANSSFVVLPIITIKPETKLLDSVTYNGITVQSQYGAYVIGPEE